MIAETYSPKINVNEAIILDYITLFKFRKSTMIFS